MIRNDHNLIDWSSPVDWSNPINAGLALWWLDTGRPGHRGGSSWKDLVKKRQMTFTTGSTDPVQGKWRGSTRPGGVGCFKFDGVDDQGDFGTDLLISSTRPFSVGWWQYLDSYANSFPGVITLAVSEGSPFEVFLTDAGSYDPVAFGSAVWATFHSATVFPTIGVWTRIDIVFDGVDKTSATSYAIYANGRSQGVTGSGGFGGLTNANRIGRLGDGSFYMDGRLDDITLYPARALSAADVSARYALACRGYSGLLRRLVLPHTLIEAVGGGVSFQPAWARNANSIIQPGIAA
jgi:hypothetical protein